MQVTHNSSLVYTVASVHMNMTIPQCVVSLARTVDGMAVTPVDFTINSDLLVQMLSAHPSGALSFGDEMDGGVLTYALQTGLIEGDIS